MRTIALGVMITTGLLGFALAASNQVSPYAGFESRPVKALSADEVKALRDGEGMAQSLPAELNGYPGPRHVLQLADQLALDAAQRTRAAELEAEMKQAAVTLGTEIVALETALDRVFQESKADSATIERLTAEIGAKRGALRAVHLRAHLAMADALNAEQRTRYMVLRGYGDASTTPDAPARHHHRQH